MRTLMLTRRKATYQVELYDDSIPRRVRVSFRYLVADKAQHAYERILVHPNREKLLSDFTYLYSIKPTEVIQAQQLTENSCDPSTAPGR